jgi:uncharacterized protein (DUF885 family)
MTSRAAAPADWARSFFEAHVHAHPEEGSALGLREHAARLSDPSLSEGFYEEGPERVFFAFCDAIRAMRVLLDLGLHAQGMTEREAVEMVTGATLMPDDWARAQIVRSKRIPLQSLTYLVGATEIAALKEGAARAMDLASFHAALLAFGPVPPSRLMGAFA